MCGPSGAGKTTYARRLEAAGFHRLSFDAHLWERGITSEPIDPTVREEIRQQLRKRLLGLVAAGEDVVLDFSFWSRRMRDEWRAVLEPTGVVPETVHLATDRATVLARIRQRAGRGADDFRLDEETAAGYVDRFEPPVPEEGPLTVLVDDHLFDVAVREPGVYDYTWVDHRDGGYGFSATVSDRSALDGHRHAESIRDFLASVDPRTGYVEDAEEQG